MKIIKAILFVQFISFFFISCNESEDVYEAPVLIGAEYNGSVDLKTQEINAMGTVKRLLGDEIASHFKIEIIEQEDSLDVFEVESVDGKIILRGSNGVSACRGLKWYLNNLCNSSLSWRGDNISLPDPLPEVLAKHREATPFQHRYMFNFCVFSYSMSWWQWPEWERTIDFMAFNGINLPLAPIGQEKIWQETYKEFGLTPKDLETYFAGLPWQAWHWMANIDAWGGPLSQSLIDKQANMQKQILTRMRALGMKPVLNGFSGHVPKVLKEKVFPDLYAHEIHWGGFESILALDQEDERFDQIAKIFLKKQKEIFGTDHFYAIDPFNEMEPPSMEPAYRAAIGKKIFESMDAGDPEGIWVLQTWFAKTPHWANNLWPNEQTKAFFDAVPDDRMIALELNAERWEMTGWEKQHGWYNKPWIWNVVQSFGDQVDIFGGLPQIFNNYNRMQASPGKGNPIGMGIMTEGIGYNPVVFELLFDMMWGDGVTNLNEWKSDYLLKRYGKNIPSIKKAWDILFESRYTSIERTGNSPLIYAPKLRDDSGPDRQIVEAWKLMLEASDELKDCETYHFDLINLGREAMGIYSTHYISLVKESYEAKNLEGLQNNADSLLQYIRDYDKLMGTSEYFSLGKWTNSARELGGSEDESNHLEWAAKRQITDWGGNVGSYAVKEWSGIVGNRSLPLWKMYLKALIEEIERGNTSSMEEYNEHAKEFKEKWPFERTNLPSEGQGNPVEISKEMWAKYGHNMWEIIQKQPKKLQIETPAGIALNKTVTASDVTGNNNPELAIDGDFKERDLAWLASTPATLTVDLGDVQKVTGFHVYPSWKYRWPYQYLIEISSDGENWSTAVDMSENKERTTINGFLHNYKITRPTGFKARYVRLNVLESGSRGVHIVEFKIFDGSEDIEE